MEVDIDKMDPGLASAAIGALGLSGTVEYLNGKLVIYGPANRETIAAQVRQAYSAQVIQSQAKKYGWQLKEVAPFKYQVVRR